VGDNWKRVDPEKVVVDPTASTNSIPLLVDNLKSEKFL
jgi:hypothetical protein